MNLKCFFGFHDFDHQFDIGKDYPITQPVLGSYLFYPDVKIRCSNCLKVKDARNNEDYKLPEIIFHKDDTNGHRTTKINT